MSFLEKKVHGVWHHDSQFCLHLHKCPISFLRLQLLPHHCHPFKKRTCISEHWIVFCNPEKLYIWDFGTARSCLLCTYTKSGIFYFSAINSDFPLCLKLGIKHFYFVLSFVYVFLLFLEATGYTTFLFNHPSHNSSQAPRSSHFPIICPLLLPFPSIPW